MLPAVATDQNTIALVLLSLKLKSKFQGILAFISYRHTEIRGEIIDVALPKGHIECSIAMKQYSMFVKNQYRRELNRCKNRALRDPAAQN